MLDKFRKLLSRREIFGLWGRTRTREVGTVLLLLFVGTVIVFVGTVVVVVVVLFVGTVRTAGPVFSLKMFRMGGVDRAGA